MSITASHAAYETAHPSKRARHVAAQKESVIGDVQRLAASIVCCALRRQQSTPVGSAPCQFHSPYMQSPRAPRSPFPARNKAQAAGHVLAAAEVESVNGMRRGRWVGELGVGWSVHASPSDIAVDTACTV
eukprot:366072-Chlamydomonas_euryale.AAC.9